MYTPAHFSADESLQRDFLSAVQAVDLVSAGPVGLVATFLPITFDEASNVVATHMARNNDQWQHLHDADALLIAHGTNAYISPSWYESKIEHGRVVPTWNYITAHLYVRTFVHEDPEWLRGQVDALTARHEERRDVPWEVNDAPEAFIEGQLRAIVGIECRIQRIEFKAKMSQNRPEADREGVVTGLTADGADETAAAVAKFNPSLRG